MNVISRDKKQLIHLSRISQGIKITLLPESKQRNSSMSWPKKVPVPNEFAPLILPLDNTLYQLQMYFDKHVCDLSALNLSYQISLDFCLHYFF